MKKNTLLLAVLLTLSGCSEINQPLESLSTKLKSISDRIKHEDKVVDSKTTSEKKNFPSLATAEQLVVKSDTRRTEVSKDEAPKSAPLNTSIPKALVDEPPQQLITQPKPAEASPAIPPKATTPKEVKSLSINEHISLSALNSHNWQISKILVTNNFTANEDHWLFSFDKAGKYKAFGACNYLTGKFNAGDDGAFRLGKLETSLNDCPESKDEEVMVFNMLLMADSFAFRDDTLVLKSGDKVMMELVASKKDINVKMAKKSHVKKDKKSSKSKTAKKKAQKNGQPKVSQPSNQKHSKSTHKQKK